MQDIYETRNWAGKFASDHYPVIVEVAVRWTFPGHSPL